MLASKRFCDPAAPRWLTVLAAVVASIMLAACGGDYSGSLPPPGGGGGGGFTGSAYLGPITGGTASLFNVNPDGTNNGAAVETVTTTATGFTFTHSIAGPSRVCVGGGTYLDEATNATQTNTMTLCALVGGATTQVFITPMSSFVDEIVKAQLKLKTAPTAADFTAALAAANTLISSVFTVTKTVDAIQPSFNKTDATANVDAYKLGAVLGAYSQLVVDYLARCGGNRQEVLIALLKDIGDKVFDAKTINAAAGALTVQYTCGGTLVDLPVSAGSGDVITAFGEFALTTQGQAMDINGNATVLANVKGNIFAGPTAPPVNTTTPSQGLIAIDPQHNIGYVPVYTLDATGNGQIAVVDLNVSVASPVLKVISLPGTPTPIASNFSASNGRVYVLAATGTGAMKIHVINSAGNTLETSVDSTGLSFSGSFGGIIVDNGRNHVVVAGTNAIGLLDISTATPTWNAASVINVGGTDSFSLNPVTGIIFVSSDGTMSTIDSTVSPMVQTGYPASLGTTDGVAFDSSTNMMIITPEFQDLAYVINMNGFTAGTVAPTLSVTGTGQTTAPVGEGPGGQVAVNIASHQALVADEFGHNLRLVQMPGSALAAGTAATATNAFTVAGTILPKATINGTATQLGMRGDPNSVTMDAAHNMAYVLADTQPSYHGFGPTYNPLFLIRVPLAGATVGTPWTPAMNVIPMP